MIIEDLVLGVIGLIFRFFKTLALYVLKILTRSKLSITELEEKYKDSSKPYNIAFGLFVLVIYSLILLF